MVLAGSKSARIRSNLCAATVFCTGIGFAFLLNAFVPKVLHHFEGYTNRSLLSKNYASTEEQTTSYAVAQHASTLSTLSTSSPRRKIAQNLEDCPTVNRTDCYNRVVMDSVSFYSFPAHIHEAAEQDSSEITNASDRLFKEIRIVCLVLTQPASHKTRAAAVKQTWGQKCNRLIFLSSKEDHDLGSVDLDVKESRTTLWEKTVKGLMLAHSKYRSELDWVLKSDDDTWVFMENLRHLLSAYNPDFPLLFGHRFKPLTPLGYMSGGAGYAISSGALDKLVNTGTLADLLKDEKEYKRIKRAEDVTVGTILVKVGIVIGDSRDEQGRERFLPLPYETYLRPERLAAIPWVPKWCYYPQTSGKGCCSNISISTHYVEASSMKAYYYLTYTRRRFPGQY